MLEDDLDALVYHLGDKEFVTGRPVSLTYPHCVDLLMRLQVISWQCCFQLTGCATRCVCFGRAAVVTSANLEV